MLHCPDARWVRVPEGLPNRTVPQRHQGQPDPRGDQPGKIGTTNRAVPPRHQGQPDPRGDQPGKI